MITFETIDKLELATLKEGDLVQVLGEFSEGDVALMTGKVYPALHNSSNRLVTIANGLKVEVFPTPLGDKDVTKKYVNERDDKIKEQVNNLHTKRESIVWRSGLRVTDELQLYVHDGVEYLPDSRLIPYTTSSSFANDVLQGRWSTYTLLTRIQQWRDVGDVRGWLVKGDGTDETQKIQESISENAEGRRKTKFPEGRFGVTSLDCDIDYLNIKGESNTVFLYLGEGNETVFNVSKTKPSQQVRFENFKLYLQNKPNVVGFDLTMFTNQSLMEDIFIGEVKLKSIGVRVNSGWFFHYNRVTVEGSLSGIDDRTGVGLEIISSHEAINGISFTNFRAHSLDKGVRFITDKYSCYGNFFRGGNIESNNVGIEILDPNGKEINQLSFSDMYMEGNKESTFRINCVTSTAFISLDNIYSDIHTGLLDSTDNKAIITLEECQYMSIKNTNGNWVSARDVNKSDKTDDNYRVVNSSSRAITPTSSTGQITSDITVDGTSFGLVPVLTQRREAAKSDALVTHTFKNAQTKSAIPYGGFMATLEVFIYPAYSSTDTKYAKYALLKTDNTHYRLKLIGGAESALTFNATRELASGDVNINLKNAELNYIQLVWTCY